ncbi:MAG: putative baseplate assembly protein [Paracoccaceae bacterium]
MAGPDKTSPCGDTDLGPYRPDNRAGLAQIAYRITTQPEAQARMLYSLPRQSVTDPDTAADLQPLAALRTRNLQDPTISLLDAWAMACDVVSFYAERIANEGYIGTATHRRSVLELARMIGYELAPGVASGVHLAFSVEDSDNPYRVVQIGPGVQAMSIPHEKGKLPQIFETTEEITARAEWNDIHARTERPQNLVLYSNPSDDEDAANGTLYLFDTDNSFDDASLADPALVTITAEAALAHYHPMTRRLDLPALLAKRIADHATNAEIQPVLYALPVNEVCLTGLGLNLRRGTRMLAVAQATAEGAPVTALPLRVVSATEDRLFGLTRAVLTRSGTAPEKVRRAPLFRLAKLVVGVMPATRIALGTDVIETHVRGKTWSGDGLSALVQSQSWQRAKIMTLVRLLVAPPPEQDDGEQPALGLHVMRDSAGFFGNTAPLYTTVNYGTKGDTPDKGPYTYDWDSAPNTIWRDGLGAIYGASSDSHVYLDREIKELQPNGWAIIENAKGGSLGLRVRHVAAESRADYAITGKSTGVGFFTAAGDAPDLAASDSIYNSFFFRSSQIHAVSTYLPLSGLPLSAELPQKSTSVELDRLYLDLERGRPVSLSGARNDAEGINGRETHIIDEVQHIDGITRLVLGGETAWPYDRTTVRINANVARATHGETVGEDLGSGDARLTFQTFTLKKPPLTFVSAANETGRASTLQIRVDGALWDEVAALGQAGAQDAVYQVRLSDDGKAHVRFGDGVTGRRLPTGSLNIKAVYRSGIGLAGEVPEEAISQLKTRPLGVRAVINPSPATGAADPETLDSARATAPGTVKTLGRIVSLMDYADFARGFAGVGKAQARELWSGQNKVIHVTVAPQAEAELTEADPLMVNLADAMAKVRDPSRPLILQPYAHRFFALTAKIAHDPAYRAEDVALWARQQIEGLFGYGARDLAQSVSAAQVIAALHQATGVVSVDLDALEVLLDGSVTGGVAVDLASVLQALPATGPGQRGQGAGFAPAQLLTVLPSAITLTMTEVADV